MATMKGSAGKTGLGAPNAAVHSRCDFPETPTNEYIYIYIYIYTHDSAKVDILLYALFTGTNVQSLPVDLGPGELLASCEPKKHDDYKQPNQNDRSIIYVSGRDG